MENNNTQQGFSMEEYANFLKQIKAGSPVHKINFSIENPNAIAGMYLMTIPNVKEYIDNIMDKSDVTNDTLLVFEARHVIECCQIMYGCLYALESIRAVQVNKRWVINRLLSTLLIRPMFYNDVLTEFSIIASDAIKNDGSKPMQVAFSNFKYVLENIWFIPYSDIDKVAEEAIKEFQNKCEESNNE